MAYGVKYISTAKGLSPVWWKIELLEKDYSGSTIDIRMVGDGITIGYDREDSRFNTIYSRYAILNLKVNSQLNLNSLQFDDERKFQVKIYKNNVLEFIGWLIPFYSSQEFEDDVVSSISVMAKDGINQLKNKPYVNIKPEVLSKKQSFKDLIIQSLNEVGYNLNTEIYYNKYEDGMNKTSSDCPLAQCYVNIESFIDTDGTFINYYEVIYRLLLEHDLRITQVGGVWVVLSPIELIDGSISGRVFNYLGARTANKTLSTDINIHTDGLKVITSSQIRKSIPIQQFTANFEFGADKNLVLNGELKDFSNFEPNKWHLSDGWVNGEIQENTGGGIIFQNTYATRPSQIQINAPIADASLSSNKYLESDQINVEGLDTFILEAETYFDADIDAIRIRVEFYDEGGINKTYVDEFGKLTLVPSSIYSYNQEVDSYRLIKIEWENLTKYGFLTTFKYMKIRIYEGIRLRSGTPTGTTVKYKNIKVTGKPQNFKKTFIGKKYEISNTSLTSSKKEDEFRFFYKDSNDVYEPQSVYRLYLNDNANENLSKTSGKWKRTAESTGRTLIESVLIDRLAVTAKFSDIFEGSIYGYIDISKTPALVDAEQRFIVLWCEYKLATNTTELLLCENTTDAINLNIKKFNVFDDDSIIEVTNESEVGDLINVGEKFNRPVTSEGGVVHGVLYPDGGIDALPIDTTNPRAGNKGILIFGANYAEGIQLGNRNNQTLVEVLGGKLNIGDSKLYSYDITTGDDEVFVGLGIDSHEFQVDGRIMAVGGVEVGQGGVWITKQITPEGLIYGQITAETAITVNSPIVNFPTQIYIKEVGGIGENPVQFNTQVEFNQPIFITESSDPRSAVTKQQLEIAVADLTLGEFGQYLDSNENPNIFDAPYGASYVAGLLTNLPNGMYKGHSIKMAIGQDKPNEATYMAFGLPRDDFDGKIYLRGIYENGEVDTGWKAVGGDIQNFTIYRNEAEIQRLGYYYEIDKGDQNVFVGFDKTNGYFEIAMMIADSESVIVTEARTVMRAEDGRLCYQFGNNEPVKYALASEVGTGAAIAYSGQSPISVDGTLIKIQVANGSQNGYLSSADWTTFNNKVSDGGTINDSLKFAFAKQMMFMASNGTDIIHKEYSTWTGSNRFHEETTGDRSMGVTGSLELNANKYFLNGFEIDMSGFATGKVLKATSSSKAEWVTP